MARRGAPDRTLLSLFLELWGTDFQYYQPPSWWCPYCGRNLSRALGGLVCHRCQIRTRVTLRAEVFHSRIPYYRWMLAIAMVSSGASARQLTLLGVSYKTAWRINNSIRRTLDLPTLKRRKVRSSHLFHRLMNLNHRLFENLAYRAMVSQVFYDHEISK